jgi:hypothetical protein
MSQNVLCWLLNEIQVNRAFLPTLVKIHSFVQQTADIREPRRSGFRPFIITRFSTIFSIIRDCFRRIVMRPRGPSHFPDQSDSALPHGPDVQFSFCIIIFK